MQSGKRNSGRLILAIWDCDITSEGGIGENKNRGGLVNATATCDITLEGVKWNRRRANRIGGGSNAVISDWRRENGAMRVLTKFQVNLVIPNKTHLCLYFNQGGDTYIYGDFIIFLIWGGKIK